MSFLLEKEEPKPKKSVPKTSRKVAPNALLQKGEMGGTLTMAAMFSLKYAGTKKARWFKPPLDEEGFSTACDNPDMNTFRKLARDLKRYYGYDILEDLRKNNP